MDLTSNCGQGLTQNSTFITNYEEDETDRVTSIHEMCCPQCECHVTKNLIEKNHSNTDMKTV